MVPGEQYDSKRKTGGGGSMTKRDYMESEAVKNNLTLDEFLLMVIDLGLTVDECDCGWYLCPGWTTVSALHFGRGRMPRGMLKGNT